MSELEIQESALEGIREAVSDLAAAEDELEPCVYCGMPAESVDHVIPRAFAAAVNDSVGPMHKTMLAFGRTVPACQECNSMLGSSALFTMTERRSLVKERLRKKYRRLLDSPDWTPMELAELSGRLRDRVIAAQAKKELLRRRVRWPQ